MTIKVEPGGRLYLPDSITQGLSLQDGDWLECRMEDNALILTPVNLRSTGAFPPRTRPCHCLFRLLFPVLGGAAGPDPRPQSHGNPGTALFPPG